MLGVSVPALRCLPVLLDPSADIGITIGADVNSTNDGLHLNNQGSGNISVTTLKGFNINTAGFVIVGMFIVTWAAAILIWRYAHIEERWSARLQGAGGKETPLSPPWAGAGASD